MVSSSPRSKTSCSRVTTFSRNSFPVPVFPETRVAQILTSFHRVPEHPRLTSVSVYVLINAPLDIQGGISWIRLTQNTNCP